MLTRNSFLKNDPSRDALGMWIPWYLQWMFAVLICLCLSKTVAQTLLPVTCTSVCGHVYLSVSNCPLESSLGFKLSVTF